MTDRDLDRYLSGEPEIVPSSGFTANVMDAVKREAATLPPIPFPWRWAIPGMLGALLIVVCFVAMLMTPQHAGGAPLPLPQISAWLDAARAMGAGWIGLALLVSAAAVKMAKLLASA
jgi:hypothetical protein